MNKAGSHRTVGWLSVLYAVVMGALLAALLIEELVPVHGFILRTACGAVLLLALLVLVLIAWRLVRFRSRAYALLRRLVAGDYEAGISTPRFWKDEVSELERLLNRLVEQLRQYDELRTGRIRQLRMTLDLVLDHSREPMVLLDVEKGTLDFSAAMAEILDGSRQSVKLDVLRNLDSNGPFLELLRCTIDEERCPQEEAVAIQLPGQKSPKNVHVRAVPHKDKDGAVSMVAVFVKAERESEEAASP
ncbi:MAG TPA: hypothetical protein ENN80_10165 [Candidatus Hydrogenedentes bacterium]|nr:hypothetical protein [Candidatus Hydrogenedentota bacterium]